MYGCLGWSYACHLPSTMTRLGGMVQQSFDGVRVTMDMGREVALSSVMVASMAGMTKFMRILPWRLLNGSMEVTTFVACAWGTR
jgi:hypothetical protein